MPNQEIVNYIKASLANKIPLEKIKKQLLSSGWANDEIQEALDVAMPRRFAPRRLPRRRIPRFSRPAPPPRSSPEVSPHPSSRININQLLVYGLIFVGVILLIVATFWYFSRLS